MRQPSKNIPLTNSSQPKVEFVPVIDFNQSQSSYPNILDQAFILYSDEEMISASSQSQYSHASFESKSIPFSQPDDHMEVRSQKSQTNMMGNFINNEESSIYDVKESECSESGKELLHDFQPLFKQNVFRRRSPRFTTHEQTLERQEKHQNGIEKGQNTGKNEHQNLQMIEDQKSPLNQATQILEEKEEQQMFMKSNIKKNQKSPKIFSLRVTRSKKNDKYETFYKGNDTTLDDSQLPKETNSNQYLSQLTKDFLLTARKQKRIKKAQKEKTNYHNRGHHYSLRNN